MHILPDIIYFFYTDIFFQYFKAARKITEDIHEKQLKSQSKRRHVERLKSSTIKPSLLKVFTSPDQCIRTKREFNLIKHF